MPSQDKLQAVQTEIVPLSANWRFAIDPQDQGEGHYLLRLRVVCPTGFTVIERTYDSAGQVVQPGE